MNFVNSWKSKNKQYDKFNLNLRIGSVTILKMYIDVSRKDYKFTLLNFGIQK